MKRMILWALFVVLGIAVYGAGYYLGRKLRIENMEQEVLLK